MLRKRSIKAVIAQQQSCVTHDRQLGFDSHDGEWIFIFSLWRETEVVALTVNQLLMSLKLGTERLNTRFPFVNKA